MEDSMEENNKKKKRWLKNLGEALHMELREHKSSFIVYFTLRFLVIVMMILQLMNRKTTREDFINLVEKMRARIPGLTFSTDVMVGFPTETEEEYEETLSMMEIMGCTEAFMYYYNPREGTPSARMDGQIEEKEKIRRLERLISEQLERARKIKESMLPFRTKVLVRGETRDDKSRLLGYSEHNDMVSFRPGRSHKAGDMVNVYVTELNGNTFRGVEEDV